MERRIDKKEYSIRQILSESWKRFTQHFLLIVLVTVAVSIPINGVMYFVPLDTLIEQMGLLRGIRVYSLILRALEGFIGIIAVMAIMYIVQQSRDGKRVRFTEVLKKALYRWPAAVGTGIMRNIFLFGLTLLLIVPGVIYTVYWTFWLPVVVLHHQAGKRALDYSKSVVKGRWWKVVGYSLVFGILAVVVSLGLGVVDGLLSDGFKSVAALLSRDGATSVFSVFSVVFDILFSSFTDSFLEYFTVVSTIFFMNFDRTKKKGVTG